MTNRAYAKSNVVFCATVFRRPCVIRKLGATIEVCLDKAIFLKIQDPLFSMSAI